MNRCLPGLRTIGSNSARPLKRLLLIAVAALLPAGIAVPAAFGQTGLYTLNGGSASETGQTYAATLTDQSAIYVLNAGHLVLTDCTMTKTGNSSSVNNSSQYGINAGILARSAGTVAITGGSITTNASGANGLFAAGAGSAISMSGGVISASGNGAHGVDVTYGGAITLSDVDITTNGQNSSALATDFGGGSVTVTGGTIVSSSTAPNSHSAGIYSTGDIVVTGATIVSHGDCGGVIDGANSITLTDTDLTGALHGIKTWKTAPMPGTASVTIDGGSLTASGGDAFHVTAETGNSASTAITVKGGATINASGVILHVLGSSTASFTADDVTLTGRLYAEDAADATATFQHDATLTGAISGIGLTMDSSSSWIVTSNSILTYLVDPDAISEGTVTNIIGNGRSVHYDASLAQNAYLGGGTYALVNGGVLTPDTVPVEGMSWGAVKAAFQEQDR